MADKEYSQIIVNRILSLKHSRGLSIRKLAEMSGINHSTLESLIEGKSQNPTIKTLHKIAIAFGMTPAEFLDFKEFSEYSFEDETDEDE